MELVPAAAYELVPGANTVTRRMQNAGLPAAAGSAGIARSKLSNAEVDPDEVIPTATQLPEIDVLYCT